MIWTTSVIDKIIDSGAPVEQQRAINDKLALLVKICGEHVPYAPAPHVEWVETEQELHLSWHWVKRTRTFRIMADADGVLTVMLWLSTSAVEKENPTDEDITQQALTFFEGYDPT